jgi:hypothetical protein
MDTSITPKPPQSDPYDVDFDALLAAIPVKKIVLGLAAALVLVYAGDWIAIALRADKFATVTVYRVNAMLLKGSKIDFQPDGSDDVRCVRSLFPHYGSRPCWYVRKHTTLETDI